MSFGGSGFSSGGTQGAALAIQYGGPLQTIAELRAIGEVDRNDQMQRLVEDKGVNYRFDLEGVGVDDGDLIITPTVGPGRWFKTSEPGGGPPAVHAPSHTDGSDDIQSATAGQIGLATAAQITKLDGIEALADVTGTNPPQAHAASHAENASDEILVEGLGTAETDPLLALMPDGSGGLAFGSVGGLLQPGTDIITAAITALAAGGGKVNLDAGVFTIDAADTLFDKSNVVIEGQGPATIIDLTGTTATKAFNIGAFDNITIKNLTIKLNDAGGGLTGIVFAAGQTGHKVENVIFENVQGVNTAFIDVNTSDSDIAGCAGTVTAGTIATAIVSATGPSGLKVSHCRFDGAETGISLFHDEAEVSHCDITDFKTGFAISFAGDRCKINGGRITFTTGAVANTAIELAGTADNTTIDDVTIIGTGNTSTSSIGINVNGGADKCSMTGCRFITLPGKGVNVFGTRASFTGCHFQGSSGTAAAITLNGPGSSITGGHIEDFDTAIDLVTSGESTVSNVNIILRSVSGARGIKVVGNLCTITGCNIDGNGAAASNIVGIELASGGDGGTITGGSIRNFTANGTAIAVTGTHTDATITGVHIDTVRFGVTVATGASRAKIIDCTIRTLSGDGVTLTSVADCKVSDCHFSTVTGTEILETGTTNFTQINDNWLKGGTITTVGKNSEVTGNFPDVKQIIWFTMPEPDKMRIVSVKWPIIRIDAAKYSKGINVTKVLGALDTSGTYTVVVEDWDDPADGAPNSVGSAVIAAALEDDSGAIDIDVAAGRYLMAIPPVTDANWVNIGVEFTPKTN